MKKYYIRIFDRDEAEFNKFLKRNKINGFILSFDTVPEATRLYSISATDEEMIAIKLSFNLKGCVDFTKTMGRLVSKQTVDL
jgi:hypothetical protein